MSGQYIACLGVPYFGVTVARQADPSLAEKPLALLDENGRVLAVDAWAAVARVIPGIPEHQVRARCPEAVCVPAARYPLWEAQDALLRQAQGYSDRWQPVALGSLYLVPPSGTTPETADDFVGWCQALAGEVRRLGWDPGLGITSSKFGAGVMGQAAGPNSMLFAAPQAQRSVLAGQPVTTLPLAEDTLMQLRHLGIRTLGQFSRLPAAGVQARFGLAGRAAQRWALGQDDRPVIPPWEAPEVTARLEFDGLLADRERLLAALSRRAERLLLPLQERLQAVSRLALLVTRADGRVVPGNYVFPLPTAATGSIRLGLAAALDRVPWDGQPAAEITLVLAGITDAPGQQLALFDLNLDGRARLAATLRRLSTRFGPETFRMAVLVDAENPLPERRTIWREFDA